MLNTSTVADYHDVNVTYKEVDNVAAESPLMGVFLMGNALLGCYCNYCILYVLSLREEAYGINFNTLSSRHIYNLQLISGWCRNGVDM